MNFLKRAVLAVTRRKSKSVIMFVMFAAIANMVLAGLAIQHATQYASVLARQKLGSQLTLSYDTQSALQKARAQEQQQGQQQGQQQRKRIVSEPITEDMAKTVASQKNITGYNYVVNANGLAEGFEPVVTGDDNQQQNTGNNNQGEGHNGAGGQANFTIPDVTVTGVSSLGMDSAFKNGEAKIINGRSITTDDTDKKSAVIEKNLAQQNGLKVGDKIKIKATRADDTVEYSIVGIYESTSNSTSSGQGMRNMPFTEPYNKIYVDYKSAIPLKTVSTDTGVTKGGIDSAMFYVDDPQNIDKVKADAKNMNIDWSKYVLDANDTAYKQMMEPIDNVASFSMMVVYIVAIAGALILALLLMLSIKERMFETGVLLSMGEGKFKIIAQYIAEVMIIAAIAFSLSIFSGRFIAQGVGNMLLDREIKVTQEQANNGNMAYAGRGFGQRQGGEFGRLLGQGYQAVNSLNIQVTTSEVGQMSVAGLIILLAGTVLPASAVMRYKPKTILTKAT